MQSIWFVIMLLCTWTSVFYHLKEFDRGKKRAKENHHRRSISVFIVMTVKIKYFWERTFLFKHHQRFVLKRSEKCLKWIFESDCCFFWVLVLILDYILLISRVYIITRGHWSESLIHIFVLLLTFAVTFFKKRRVENFGSLWRKYWLIISHKCSRMNRPSKEINIHNSRLRRQMRTRSRTLSQDRMTNANLSSSLPSFVAAPPRHFLRVPSIR